MRKILAFINQFAVEERLRTHSCCCSGSRCWCGSLSWRWFPNANLSTNAIEAIINGATMIREGQFPSDPEFPLWVPPLTALFVAAIQSVFGDSLLPVKLAQVLLDGLMVLMVFGIGRMLVPYRAALLGALVVAVYPFGAMTPIYIGTESLFSFFLAAFLLVALRSLRSESVMGFLGAGVLLGLACMVRGSAQYFPVFFVGLLAWITWRKRGAAAKFFAQSAVFVIGFAIVVGPWAYRNVTVLGAFIPTSIPGLPLVNGSSEDFWEIEDRRRNFPAYAQHLKDHRCGESGKPTWVVKDRFYREAAIEKYRLRWQQDPCVVPMVSRPEIRPHVVCNGNRKQPCAHTGNSFAYIWLRPPRVVAAVARSQRRHTGRSWAACILHHHSRGGIFAVQIHRAGDALHHPDCESWFPANLEMLSSARGRGSTSGEALTAS